MAFLSAGERLKLFRAAITVFRFDVPACLFLIPYLVHNVVAYGSDAARHGIQQASPQLAGDLVRYVHYVRGLHVIGCMPAALQWVAFFKHVCGARLQPRRCRG
jgi:hypothetical protein